MILVLLTNSSRKLKLIPEIQHNQCDWLFGK